MNNLRLSAMALVVGCGMSGLSSGAAFAAGETIVLVGPGLQGEIDFAATLEGQGYNVVTKFESSGGDEDLTGVLNASEISSLESADLVLISRMANSASYSGDDPVVNAQWNGISTPLINMSSYLLRSSRWDWIGSNTVPNQTSSSLVMDVASPSDPVFDGVTLAADNSLVATIADPSRINFQNGIDGGNGSVLARDINGNIWISRYVANKPFHAGSGSATPSGRRMFFMASAGEGGDALGGNLLLNEDGTQIFLNAVSDMISGSPDHSGDFDLDGDIDLDDFQNMMNHMYVDTAVYSQGNIDEYQGVTEDDFLLFRDLYLAANPGSSASDLVMVPEPTTAALLILGGVGLLSRKK